LEFLVAQVSMLLATQEMQGAHVYVLGVIAVGAAGGLIYALVRRVGKSLKDRTRSDREPETVQGPETAGSNRGPGA